MTRPEKTMSENDPEASARDPAAGPAPLWRRLLAFAVDMTVIVLPTWVVGNAFFDAMSDLGDFGRLIGLGIALVYFGIFDSDWGDGRSPGKGLLGLRVVRTDGTLLSPPAAAMRAGALFVPFLVNGVGGGLPLGAGMLVQSLLAFACFGIALSMLYLVLFNRRSRQSLHDLLVGAVVAGRAGPLPSVPPFWKGHLAVVGIVCIAALAVPAVRMTPSGASADLGEMVAMESRVESLPPIRNAGIGIVKVACLTCADDTANEFFRVTVRLRHGPAETAVLGQVADAVFRGHERFVGSRRVLIVLDRGFNLGFAAGDRQTTIWTTVAQWQEGHFAGAARTDTRIFGAGSPPSAANVLPIMPAQNKTRNADSSDADNKTVGGEYSALYNHAAELVKAGKFAEAIAPASAALTAAEAQLGPDQPDTGRILVFLAQLYRHEGKYDEAEPLHKKGLAIMEKAVGTDNDEIIRYRESLASLYHIERRYPEAESLLGKSLMSRETLSGPGNPEVCKDLDALAMLYQSQKRYDEAEAAIKRCLAARENVLGPDHPQVGQSLHQLARLYREDGRSADALPIFERALALLGPNHPEAILAAIAAGDFDKAAHSLGIRNPPGDSEALARAVRRTFLGQVTELRWMSSRMNADTLLIDGEVMQGNGLWQPFSAQMANENGEWKLVSIMLLGLAWK
jgi:tetratricopeptide (TPR) repeat protein/uncharacterized RDD family membrane protein YckC